MIHFYANVIFVIIAFTSFLFIGSFSYSCLLTGLADRLALAVAL
jgi:hypothetical protein